MAPIKHLNLEITKKCNQRCFYCFNNSGKAIFDEGLTLPTWMRILCVMKQRGLRSILVTGGEPFVWPNIMELLSGAQELGIATSVLSNGFRIPYYAQKHPDIFCRLVVAQISLDSMNPIEHDQRRGANGAWNDAINAISFLRKLDVSVEVSCTVSDENLKNLIDVGEYTKSVSAKLLIRPLARVGRASHIVISPSFKEHLDTVTNHLQASYGVEIVSDRFFYAPIFSQIDIEAYNSGILTVESSGKFRCGKLATSDNFGIDDLTELLKAA